MKKNYQAPEAEILRFETESILDGDALSKVGTVNSGAPSQGKVNFGGGSGVPTF